MSGLATNIAQHAAHAFRWWSCELKSVIPERLRTANTAPKSDVVVLVRKGVIVSTVPEVRGQVGEDAVLAELSRRSRNGSLRVTIRVPTQDCLVRPISVPRRALPNITQIANLDLERATPFHHGDVYTSVWVKDAGSRAKPVSAEQYLLKRKSIEKARARIEQVGATVVGADCYTADPVQPLPFDFLHALQTSETGAERRRSSGPVLAALSILLGCSALAVSTYRYESRLAVLKEQTTRLRAQADALRSEPTKGNRPSITALAAVKFKYPPIVEVLEEIAKIIPDTAYLTHLRLNEGTLDIGGFGRPVTNLAPQLEQSPWIESASITAPISIDEVLQKERFDLRLKIARRNATIPTGQTEVGAP